jgi:hypothetical protein
MVTYDYPIVNMAARGSRVVVGGISSGLGVPYGMTYENELVLAVNKSGVVRSVRLFLDPSKVFA